MIIELWFYLSIVLVCTGYAALMRHYPQWKIYFSIGLLGFVIAGAVLVYFDAKHKEETQTKLEQLERTLESEKKEKEKQHALTMDATERARLLAEQLRLKSEEYANVLKDQPHIEGKITEIRIFPWQRTSGSRTGVDDTVTATGILVTAHIRNEGSTTTLANWELSIQFPDNTIIKPQKGMVQTNMRIPCQDGTVTISKDGSLDAPKRPLRKTGELSGATVWDGMDGEKRIARHYSDKECFLYPHSER